MTALWIIGGILFFFLSVGLIPVGIDAAYDGTGLSLSARIGFFSLRLRRKEKARGGEKSSFRKKQGAEAERKKPKRSRRTPPLPVLRLLVLNGFRTLCGLLRRVRTDLLRIHFTSAFPDPAVTALAYGAAGTAMESLLRAGGGRLRRGELRADADFVSGAYRLDARLCMTLRVCQLLSAALGFCLRMLLDYLRYKKECA